MKSYLKIIVSPSPVALLFFCMQESNNTPIAIIFKKRGGNKVNRLGPGAFPRQSASEEQYPSSEQFGVYLCAHKRCRVKAIPFGN